MGKNSKHYLLSSRREDKDEIKFDISPSSDDEMDIETARPAADEKKQESGGALSALAFAAAVHHSKETENEGYKVEMDKDSKNIMLDSPTKEENEIKFHFYTSSDVEMDIETDLRAADEKGQESGDALPALASAATPQHSKDTKNEEYKVEMDKDSKNPLLNSCVEDEDELDDFTLYLSPDDTDTEEAQPTANEKKQESGDALPALASAATLQHSKDTKNEEYKVEIDKDLKNPLLNSCVEDEDELDDFTLYLSPEDTDTEEAQPTANEKKQESGDALPALASAATLQHSKDTKNEEYKVEMDKDSKNPLLNSCVEDEDELDDFTLYLSPDDTDTEEAQPTANEKKQESGDALPALASAATLQHSKDTKNEEYKVEMDKDSKNPLLNSCVEDEDELDDFTLYLSPDDTDTEEAQSAADAKKQESGDAFSALASGAALYHSKDRENEDYKVDMDRDSKNPLLNFCAQNDDEFDDFTLHLSSDDTDTEEAQSAPDAKKQESGDAFSVLASGAAFYHSKDRENEEYKVDMDRYSKNPLLNFCAENDDDFDDFTLHLSSDDTDTEEAQSAADAKKQESGDAFSALASGAAFHHSKDRENEEYKVDMDRDSKNPLLNFCAENDDEFDDFTLHLSSDDTDLSSDDTDTEEAQSAADAKKQESGDAFSALASGDALYHSKDTENEEHKVDMDRDSKKPLLNSCAEDLSSNNTDAEEALPATAEKKQESGDALSASTFAAALNHSRDFNKTDTITKEKESVKDDKDVWYTVGFIKGTSFNVQNYFHCEDDDSSFTVDNLADYSHLARINLEPGAAYKFRVAAINSVGRGEWSKVSTFRMCLPGLQIPPGIKIAEFTDGVQLWWKIPSAAAGEILEYYVFVAVRNNCGEKPVATGKKRSMTFERLYCGANNTCRVPKSSLAAAYIDTTTKAAIIFRIVACNDKSYGPPIQIRWLQDSRAANKTAKCGSENFKLM